MSCSLFIQIAENIKAEDEEEGMEGPGRDASIVLNDTSEFCRALGEIPTYGQSGNRAEIEKDELMVGQWLLVKCNIHLHLKSRKGLLNSSFMNRL